MSKLRLSHFFNLTLLLYAAVSSAQPAQRIEPEAGEKRAALYLVGGETTTAQPWMAALLYRPDAGAERKPTQQQFCGGTLIAPEWVLTAAHCADRLHPHEVQVLLGRTRLDDAQPGELRDVADIIVHPDFDSALVSDDVALLRLAVPSSAQPLPMAGPDARAALTGRKVDVYGWGKLFDPSAQPCKVVLDEGRNREGFTCGVVVYQTLNLPSSVMHAQLTLHDYTSCVARYRDYVESVGLTLPPDVTPNGITETSPVLCAWHDTDAAALCYGDSGGPLVGIVNGRAQLIGISSFMQRGGCQLQYQLNFFTEVGAYRDFIAAAQTHAANLSLNNVCPGRPRPRVEYGTASEGRVPVTLRWESVLNTQSYALNVVPIPLGNAQPRQIQLAGNLTEYSTYLDSGQRFLVNLQARAAHCDGEVSQAVEVKVP